jgi:hypothetical protein
MCWKWIATNWSVVLTGVALWTSFIARGNRCSRSESTALKISRVFRDMSHILSECHGHRPKTDKVSLSSPWSVRLYPGASLSTRISRILRGQRLILPGTRPLLRFGSTCPFTNHENKFQCGDLNGMIEYLRLSILVWKTEIWKSGKWFWILVEEERDWSLRLN